MYFLGITENNFGNLWILIVLANSLMLLPLPFIVLVDFEIKEEGHAKLKENDENKNNHHEESPKVIRFFFCNLLIFILFGFLL